MKAQWGEDNIFVHVYSKCPTIQWCKVRQCFKQGLDWSLIYHERTQPCLRESISLLMCTFAPAQQLLPLTVLNWSRLTIFYSYRKALDCMQMHLYFGQSMLFVIVIVQCWCLVIGSGAIVIYYRDISSRSLTSCTGCCTPVASSTVYSYWTHSDNTAMEDV